eukprot:GHRQ01016828.1.p3 GENE.GHRQ01016828.1~~GHRQ01016828.1.p3  ORF type:complete len:100 (+),score=5.78 GHRQ01016828.1:1005-1304(+)
MHDAATPLSLLRVLVSHLQDAQERVQHHLHRNALAEAAAILLQQVEQVAAVGILLHHHHAVTLLQAMAATARAAGAAVQGFEDAQPQQARRSELQPRDH